ncbi:hypothetical protein [Streptobacillus notomytis]|uniref:hypothetical protein n=1 Tax=Streptobacillus notomytis TaxID=1712031 RepID=UPI00093584AA|nr:hypothetical protein [Streptobacillus notomytis]
MRRLILSILLIIGITSFSAKKDRRNSVLNKRYEIKKVRDRKNRKSVNLNKENTVKEENIIDKKDFNLNEKNVIIEENNMNTKTRLKITGPRYRLEGSISTLPVYNDKTKQVGYYAYKSLSFLSEWKKQVTKDIDITFGPKFSANLIFSRDYSEELVKVDKSQIISTISLGTEVDFNFMIRKNVKIYIGLETSIGVGIKINTFNGADVLPEKTKEGRNTYKFYFDDEIFKSLKYMYIIKGSLGFKINDKYNVAFFAGHGKGHFGIEIGHTF